MDRPVGNRKISVRLFLQVFFTSLQFQQLIDSMPLLPILPESYSQVQSCIQVDDVKIERMGNIISHNVAL